VFAELRAILNLVWEADRPQCGVSVVTMLRHRFFSFGKTLIGLCLCLCLCLGRASFGSAYGAAGSLIVVIVWVYCSAQVFIFGAEFTHVFAHTHGSRRPAARAGVASSG